MSVKTYAIAGTIALAVLPGTAGPAPAQKSQAWPSCLNKASPDTQISGCTSVIQDGKDSKAHLAIAFGLRGVAYKNMRQYDRAIQDYNQAIKLDSNNAGFFGNRGNAYDLMGRYDRAIQDYDYVLKLRPNDATGLYLRGRIKEKKGDKVGAEADMAAARRINPNIGK